MPHKIWQVLSRPIGIPLRQLNTDAAQVLRCLVALHENHKLQLPEDRLEGTFLATPFKALKRPVHSKLDSIVPQRAPKESVNNHYGQAVWKARHQSLKGGDVNISKPPITQHSLFAAYQLVKQATLSKHEVASQKSRNFHALVAVRGYSSEQSPVLETGPVCWSCSSQRNASSLFYCEQCGAIQPADASVDDFRLLDAERAFFVDLPAIEARYKWLQKKLHPDMYARKQQVEQDYSAEQSSLVNKAYSTLVNPLSRALYLLKLNGVEAGDGDEGTVSDMELLSEVMEIRETIEEAEGVEELQQLKRENMEKMQESGAAFSTALQAGDLGKAREWVHRMTYWDRIDREITRKL